MEYDTDDSALLDVFDLVVQYKHHVLILKGITAIVSTKAPRKIASAFPDLFPAPLGGEIIKNGILVLPLCYSSFLHHYRL